MHRGYTYQAFPLFFDPFPFVVYPSDYPTGQLLEERPHPCGRSICAGFARAEKKDFVRATRAFFIKTIPAKCPIAEGSCGSLVWQIPLRSESGARGLGIFLEIFPGSEELRAACDRRGG